MWISNLNLNFYRNFVSATSLHCEPSFSECVVNTKHTVNERTITIAHNVTRKSITKQCGNPNSLSCQIVKAKSRKIKNKKIRKNLCESFVSQSEIDVLVGNRFEKQLFANQRPSSVRLTIAIEPVAGQEITIKSPTWIWKCPILMLRNWWKRQAAPFLVLFK